MPTPPRWFFWSTKVGVVVFAALGRLTHWRYVVAVVLAVMTGLAFAWGVGVGAMVSLPPSGRTTNICAALGADYGCTWAEVAHLKGEVTLVAYDPVTIGDPYNPVLVVARIKGHSVSMPIGPASEQRMLDVVDDPTTNYQNLMIGSPAWPALRELAHLSLGVPILLDARKSLTPKPTVTSSDAAAETRTLKVRIALIQLVP